MYSDKDAAYGARRTRAVAAQSAPLPGGQIQSTFENSSNVSNQAGQQIIGGDMIINRVSSEDLLNLLPSATKAAFNSSNRQHDPVCLPGTRVDVLNEITAWVNSNDERCVFWLNGMAGCGKSTIARTIARQCYEQECLGASFFFSKGDGDVSDAGKFFTSIATQLANTSDAIKSCICEAIEKQRDIANKGLHDQWHQLVLQPLSKLDSNFPHSSLILVVDALDECDDGNNIRAIVQLLAEARSLRNVQLRVFMTSRPEIPIRHEFYHIPEIQHYHFVLHNISRSIIDHDIFIFLEHNFGNFRQGRPLAPSWPGKQAIVHLVRKSGGLFIWAATAYRFISEGGPFIEKRLSRVLQGDASATKPEKQLNEIYITVLKSSISSAYDEEEKEDLYELLRGTLGAIVILFSPLSVVSLAQLLHIPQKDVELTLADLHSILDIPQDQACPVHLHHPSFRDFLLDKDRCGDPHFYIDKKKTHGSLAENCLRLMSANLKKDICDLHAPGAYAREVQIDRIEQCLPTDLQYACRYWVQHLRESEVQLEDNGKIHTFLRDHLLHWLEALSLIRETSEGVLAILSLESMVRSDKSPHLSAFIHDAKRFTLNNRSIIEEAPLQIYCSALVFAPEMSLVRKQFEKKMPRWIRRLPKVQKEWSSSLQTLEGHSGSVWAVAFSPDGKLLASASWDQTVRLWDPTTGTSLQTLEGHSGSVNAVTFSPDGKLVASASNDQTLRLWNPATGTSLQTLEGHSSSVWAVAFSPDGKLIASASWDHSVRLWDPATGTSLQTLEGHSGSARAVAFSPDGKQLASASDDDTVRLWDPAAGASLQTLEGHSGSVRAVVFSPDGKLVASASRDHSVRLWDPATLQTLEGHSSSVNAVAFSPDDKLIASASNDDTVRLWDPATGTSLQTLEGHSGLVCAVAFSPDGKLIASVSNDHSVRLWDPATGTSLQTLEGHSSSVRAVAFSPDGKLLASASDDDTVRLWDPAAGASLQTLEGHSGSVRAVVFSLDGKLVASASRDHTVRLWDPATGASLQTLEGHSSSVWAVAFSPDGKLIASASWDQTVRLWDPVTGTSLQTLEGHSGSVRVVAFSRDGRLVASASGDQTVRLWDPATGASLRKLETGPLLIRQLSFSRDSQYLDTDRGQLGISSLLPSLTPPPSESVKESEIFVNWAWVAQKMKNILWLPSDYRAACSAVQNNVLVMGHASGGVSILEMDIAEQCLIV